MTSLPQRLLEKAGEHRAVVETLVAEFAASTAANRVQQWLERLPSPGNPLRHVLLLGMIHVDMQQRWQKGQRVTVEGYAKSFSELSADGQVPFELILSEVEAKQAVGETVISADLATRFPLHADKVRHVLARSGMADDDDETATRMYEAAPPVSLSLDDEDKETRMYEGAPPAAAVVENDDLDQELPTAALVGGVIPLAPTNIVKPGLPLNPVDSQTPIAKATVSPSTTISSTNVRKVSPRVWLAASLAVIGFVVLTGLASLFVWLGYQKVPTSRALDAGNQTKVAPKPAANPQGNQPPNELVKDKAPVLAKRKMLLVQAATGLTVVDLKTQSTTTLSKLHGEPSVVGDKIYLGSGGLIQQVDIQGTLKRSISIRSRHVSRFGSFMALPDNRFALFDNGNDKIYFVDHQGNYIKTVPMKAKADTQSQNCQGVVVGKTLILSETGNRTLLRTDLQTYKASVFRSFPELPATWLGALAFHQGTYYLCTAQEIYAFGLGGENGQGNTAPIRRIVKLPENNICGIVVDGLHAYVSVNFTGKIYKVNTQTGATTLFIQGLRHPRRMVLWQGVPPKVTVNANRTLGRWDFRRRSSGTKISNVVRPIPGKPQTNPFGLRVDVPDPDGVDVKAFAARLRLPADNTDPNSPHWPATVRKAKPGSIDGIWDGRWKSGANEALWRTGTAFVQSVGERVYIKYQDKSTYLIETRRVGGNHLIGRYINQNRPSDCHPWVGVIVNDGRIDGAWATTAKPPEQITVIDLNKQKKSYRQVDRLTDTDPFDTIRKTSRRKVYTVFMEAFQTYRLNLMSQAVDCYLRIEDTQQRQLTFDDDGGDGFNSRLYVTPNRSGQYRIIATTFRPNQTGEYTLTVDWLARQLGKTSLWRDELTNADPRDTKRANCYRRVYKVPMEAGKFYRIDLVSPSFDPYLRLEDAAGRKVHEDDDSGEGLNAQITFVPTRTAEYRLVATTYRPNQTGKYILAINTKIPNPLVGQKALPIEPKSWINGIALTNEQLKGKVVLLDFWATWCPPCVKSLSQLRRWHEKYDKRGLVVLGLTRHYGYDWDVQTQRVKKVADLSVAQETRALKAFCRHHQIQHRIAVLSKNNKLYQWYKVTAIPQFVVIDRQGIIRAIHVGNTTENFLALEKMLAKLLTEPN